MSDCKTKIMRTWPSRLSRILVISLLAVSVCSPAGAHREVNQGKAKNPPGKQNPNPGKANKNGNSGKQPGKQPEAGRGMMGLPPKFIERLQGMTPQEQERFLQNNERFKNMPPDKQQQIRRQLQRWNSLTPEQQQELKKRAEIWERMTPQQQNYVRNNLLPRWQQLPPDRRQAIQRHLNQLNGLNEAEREAKLNDPSFVKGLNPDEQKMLRELSNLRVGSPETPPDNPFD